MKTVLVILTQANLGALQINESLSATMVLATFGSPVKVLLQDAALSLLNSNIVFDQLKHAFKPASNMVESFEFYDIEHLYILSKDRQHPLLKDCKYELQGVTLDQEFIAQFDHIIHW